jgi:hypothetical protein
MTRLNFSLKYNHWSSALKSNIYWQTYCISLLGTYYQHVISTFNTCLRGSTHRSLIDTGRGYNLQGGGLPHHTPRPFQPTVSRFSPKGPTRSQVNNPTNTNWTREEQTVNFMNESLHSTSTTIYHLSIALLTVSDKEIGLTRINIKVNLNATTVPSNSYKLNAQSK